MVTVAGKVKIQAAKILAPGPHLTLLGLRTQPAPRILPVMVCVVLAIFGAMGLLQLHWWALPLLVPLLMLGALAFATVGLLFTALLPSMDHMGLPFFLVIMPIAFISSTYFPLPDSAWLGLLAVGNPLHHLAEAARHLLVNGEPTRHLLYAPLLCLLMLAVLMPLDMHVLRRRVFGDH